MNNKYVVAENFAYTSNGVIFPEGAFVDVTLFKGNEGLFKKAIAEGKIVEAKEVPAEPEKTEKGDTDKEKSLSSMTKAELEAVAKEKGVDVAGKKKEEILELLKPENNDGSEKSVSEMTEYELVELAKTKGVDVSGKTKEQMIELLKEK